MKTENLLLLLGGAMLLRSKANLVGLNGFNDKGVLYIYEVTNNGLKKITGYPSSSKKEAIAAFKNSAQFQSGKIYAVVALKEMFF